MLGYSYQATGEYDEAEKAFQTYIQLIPSDPNPYDSYAELLLKMGRYDASIENYRKALELKPNFIFSHLGIASDLMCQDKSEEARAEINRLLESAADDGQRRTAYFALAVISAYEGNFDRALSEIEEQYRIAHSNADASAMAQDLIVMGRLFCESGRPDQALAKYREAHQVIQTSDLENDLKLQADRTLLNNESRVALKMGDMESAKAKADSFAVAVIRIGNPNQIRQSFELLGMLALANKDYRAAVEALLMGNMQNAYTLYRLALAFQGLGDMTKSREYCQKTVDFNGLNDLNYAFCRNKAREMLKSLPKAS
jgi:tetratricopeptide (TPR) repeat protein